MTEEWIKTMWYIHTMDYYSATRRNEFESVLVTWMNLEPVIQSEMSEGEKQILHINTESRKMVLMNLFAGKEWRHSCRKWTRWGKERVGQMEKVALTYNIYTLPYIKETAGGTLLYNTRSPAWCSVMT